MFEEELRGRGQNGRRGSHGLADAGTPGLPWSTPLIRTSAHAEKPRTQFGEAPQTSSYSPSQLHCPTFASNGDLESSFFVFLILSFFLLRLRTIFFKRTLRRGPALFLACFWKFRKDVKSLNLVVLQRKSTALQVPYRPLPSRQCLILTARAATATVTASVVERFTIARKRAFISITCSGSFR